MTDVKRDKMPYSEADFWCSDWIWTNRRSVSFSSPTSSTRRRRRSCLQWIHLDTNVLKNMPRKRGKNIVWVRVDTSWSCWVWLHPRTCTHKHEPVSELDVITDIFNMLLSPDTVPSCCKSSPSTPACQLFHQRMSNPLPATHSLHNVNNNKNCVLKSANFTQRQQLHSHIV